MRSSLAERPSKGLERYRRKMILSEFDRRWAEIRLYQFCTETYALRQQSIDIFDYTDAICKLGDIDATTIKLIIRTMLSDTYYQASKREIILIGTLKGMSTVELGKYLNMTRQGVNKYVRTNLDTFTPLPRCTIDDDHEIIKFLQTLDKLKEIGTLGYGTTNESAV